MTTPPVTARAVHYLDARLLLPLLPHMDQADLHDIRNDWARFVDSHRRQPFATWQDAWNAFTGATPHQPGSITYTPRRCATCHGRGFDTRHIARNLSRTGSPYVCGDCQGNRRGQPTRQAAHYAPTPTSPKDAS